MDASIDVFLTCLPRDVTEIAIRDLFQGIGDVTKVKIIEDKKNENHRLCFVGFGSMEEANNAVKVADKSTALGNPIKASLARKSAEGGGDSQNKNPRPNNDYRNAGFNSNSTSNSFEANKKPSFKEEVVSPRTAFNNVGRGRGMMQTKRDTVEPPSFTSKSVNLTDIKLKSRELIEVEIVDLSNLECICARPLKHTENSKVEITDLLLKVNSSSQNLRAVDTPKINDCYLGKWDDGMYYRAELLECLKDGSFKVTFVDEGTSGDIVSDIKHIPEGPLQQYPKQFTKISLGCTNSDDLRNFIIEESNEKKVSLFWLGDFRNGIPLINLFLNDDEIVEKFIQLKKVVTIRECFALKFKDLPNHNSDTDCSNMTFIQSMYKSQNDFTVQIKDPAVVLCEKRIPPILPIPGDICIYEKRNGVNNITFSRCVVKRRQLFSFDILLFDSGENLNNVSIDCLYASEDCHKVSPPFSIICELDKSLNCNEDTFQKIMSDENMKFNIVSYKGNNKYLVTATVVKKAVSHYPESMLSSLIGKSCKVIVTHLVSPTNFFVQIDDPSSIQSLNDIHGKINIAYKGGRISSLDSLKVGQAVVAPFSVDGGVGENFRATIVEKRQQSPQVHVFYIDYGNDGWVDLKQLLEVNDDIVMRPALAINCTLNVEIRKEAWSHAIELFSKLVGFTDDDPDDLVMKAIGECDSKLVVDVTSQIKGSISMALDKSGTCILKDDGRKVTPQKPVCNGDMKRETAASAVVATTIEKTEDYASLLKRVNELELRVAHLEKRTA